MGSPHGAALRPHRLEHQEKFVRTTRRCRSIQIRAGNRVLTAEDPLSSELRDALALINLRRSGAH